MNEDEKNVINEGSELPRVKVEDGALLPRRQVERSQTKNFGAEPPPSTRSKQPPKDVPDSIRRILGGCCRAV